MRCNELEYFKEYKYVIIKYYFNNKIFDMRVWCSDGYGHEGKD